MSSPSHQPDGNSDPAGRHPQGDAPCVHRQPAAPSQSLSPAAEQAAAPLGVAQPEDVAGTGESESVVEVWRELMREARGAGGGAEHGLHTDADQDSDQGSGQDAGSGPPREGAAREWGAAGAVRLAAAKGEQAPPSHSTESPSRHLALSTLLSLMVVLVLIIAVRFTVPPLVESLRYAWHRGQLRAEYEMSGERLRQVSLGSLSEVSQMVSHRVGPGVVHINMLAAVEPEHTAVDYFFSNEFLDRALRGGVAPARPAQLVGQGSGVLLDTAGHILTNQHVIDGGGRIEVSLSDGRRIPATEIGIDPLTDLAVIKIDAAGLMPVEWGDSDAMQVGWPVWAVGSPFGLERTVTFGILSGKHRIDLKGTRYESRLSGTTTYGDLMQSDVAVNPGNSGGPLVNAAGEVVGINTAIVGETYIGISFSIPSKVARRVAEALIAEGEVARGWLGLSLVDGEAAAEAGGAEQGLPRRGALVTAWARTGSSPARQAGIQPGDLIVAYDGQEVTNQRMLMSLIGQTPVGAKVSVGIIRDGAARDYEVQIGRRPAELNGYRASNR
jgi:serine protease Do